LHLGHGGVWLRKAMHGNAMQCVRVPGRCWRLTVFHRVCQQHLRVPAGDRGLFGIFMACTCVYMRVHGEQALHGDTQGVRADAKMRFRTRSEKDSV